MKTGVRFSSCVTVSGHRAVHDAGMAGMLATLYRGRLKARERESERQCRDDVEW